MVVLVGLTAAIYAALLIPFKPIPIIPGFTEIRPATVFPVVCSLMFGPAAAWGAAFGNLIGDFFGTLGPGSIFGFVGNFLYGYIPYRVWRAISNDGPSIRSFGSTIKYLAAALIASTACGVSIAWGAHILGLVPFAVLCNIILINNLLVSALLGPVLLRVLYSRVKKLGLIYTEIMSEDDLHKGRSEHIGQALLWIGSLGGLILGNITAGNPEAVSTGVGASVVILIVGTLLI